MSATCALSNEDGNRFNVCRVGKQIDPAHTGQLIACVEQGSRVPRERGNVAGDVDNSPGACTQYATKRLLRQTRAWRVHDERAFAPSGIGIAARLSRLPQV